MKRISRPAFVITGVDTYYHIVSLDQFWILILSFLIWVYEWFKFLDFNGTPEALVEDNCVICKCSIDILWLEKHLIYI